jgi:NAD(P)-dependent dehydrogenase (short-subunit alcohol dehydrogenase family)
MDTAPYYLDLAGKVVLVTGSAGNLGSAVIRRFLSVGSHLLLLDRQPDRLPKIFPDLASSPEHYLANSVDLTVYSDVEMAVHEGLEKLGKIDCLIHTAGGFQMGEKVPDIEDDSWQQMLQINITSFLNISKAVIPPMATRQSGKVVTIGARPALAGKARMGAYSASKAGLLRLTESLSREYKKSGINVNCILPGTIDTPQNREAMPGADSSNWVSPDSLAEVILFLCSSAARDIHGAAIPVYGA